MHRSVLTYLLIGCVVCTALPGLAPASTEAAAAFDEGKALLAKVDFQGALQAFKSAARKDPDNAKYRQTYAVLRQVIRIRGMIQAQEDPEQWLAMAQALRAFYYEHGIYSESLPLDRKIHSKGLAEDSAERLAETLLALGRNAEAAELLQGLEDDQATARTNVLLGIALAREGQIGTAKDLAAKLVHDVDAEPRFYFELARLRARIGEGNAMAAALAGAFERTPPSQLEALKAKARACSDLAGYADSDVFAQALATKSKVPESKCSGGTGCGKCPSRGNCGSKQSGASASKSGKKPGGKGCNKPCDMNK